MCQAARDSAAAANVVPNEGTSYMMTIFFGGGFVLSGLTPLGLFFCHLLGARHQELGRIRKEHMSQSPTRHQIVAKMAWKLAKCHVMHCYQPQRTLQTVQNWRQNAVVKLMQFSAKCHVQTKLRQIHKSLRTAAKE